MYNFRYHLVTIVSIFAALALGLLLGVALTGSDLVRDASNNLAQSLSDQFDSLNATNKELSNQLDQEQLFASQLVNDWQKDRLSGRTIALLTRAPKDKDPLTDELSSLILRNGGVPVVVRINQDKGFGLDDETTLETLKKILPEVKNEDYQVTLARALSLEWSFSYTGSGSDLADTSAGLEAQYPLTQQLMDAGIIEVTVSYQTLLDSGTDSGSSNSLTRGPASLDPQQVGLENAQSLGLPYGVNGVVDMAYYTPTGGTSSHLDSEALQIALQFNLLGQAEELPYTSTGSTGAEGSVGSTDSTDSTGSTDSAGSAGSTQSQTAASDLDLSYYALLAQEDESLDFMITAAQDNAISCVLSANAAYRDYGIVALLTGAAQGVYGPSVPGLQPFPQIPSDTQGNAPLVKAAQDRADAAAAEAAKQKSLVKN